MKIGILTFHHVNNYGATLQACALWTFLNSLGYDVEIIDYRPFKIVWKYFRPLIPLKQPKKILVNVPRAWKMRRFLVSHVKLSKKKFYDKKGLDYYRDKYDVVVCGSDQIWCLDSFRGFDSAFFLDFVSNQTTRKISYAASFGNTVKLGIYHETICNLIEQFETILVRDTNSFNLINNECNQKAIKVLDPTFLIQYDRIKTSPKIQGKYILLYIHAQIKPEEEEFIKSLAKSENLTIVSVDQPKEIAQINLESASPQEWVGLFSEASYIVTNTYHGTIFSIIFQKPFNVLVRSDKQNKVTDLLRDLNLENRIFSLNQKGQPLHKEIFDIDYDSVSKILEFRRLESKKYLLQAISPETFDDKSKAVCNQE
ncbi:MAG: polysaccharide pyruvyl transferase family protein [Nostoc sp. ChiSLP02]|nr:polysaccharide pyruvyl transferase family protein [Nostoc sp. DedSLP05]MDZ8102959.1 polysaccharide pyruvyl transferase family protein [Nostoc sp. DedSLP01]MDZ8183484.1 polysaccharide pyruvyl transferase family protein [Nostoc sp. ChiSLP02]